MIKKILLYGSLAFVLAGCSKKSTQELAIIDPVVPPPPPAAYSITEDFENAPTKTAYASAVVKMPTGSWTLDDALIGNTAPDLKNGLKSIRLRTGSVTMNFDVNGLKMLYIKHGKYGTDAASTWKLLMSTDGGTTYTQLGADIAEDNSTLKLDSFAVTTTGKVRFQIQKAGTTRINLDDITFRGTGDPGILVSIPDTDPADPVGGSAATPRGVTAGTDAQPAVGDNSNLLFGNPSNANSVSMDNFLLDQSYYVESYSSSRGTPNWVSWHLDASNITGASDRLNNFAGFNGLPQSAFVVQSNSYSGSGFDRGHNTPSADRTSSANANSATFLMTNMIPQAPQNNQQTWGNLESYLRTKVLEGNEIYIIMGSYGIGGTGSNGAATTIAGGKVTVPSNVWKVAVIIPVGNDDISRVSANTRVIAVNTPNINTIDSDWKKYRVSVKAIETATGYTLLSALPAGIQDAIKTKVDTAN
ncbi:MAG: DNA/RNA non-specific endonuclease [Candidatus Pedobacter colombiensis]|uniref:DNA/RNA non-specific endonuclease n=1 Tax=Candidatus Pedobacter colombiensis TaxID=3121371 RepID=A0AAJ5WBG8_9SPHI|nr:DNA/RNA non-specific endonuclease [Pedobacter sp.]WEK21502.1 MAG: DNA/RNA non-specific endonuclease [Pedobacter sp.]